MTRFGIPLPVRLRPGRGPRHQRPWAPNPADDADRLPSNSSVPVITGTGTVGQTLSASTGVWVRARPNGYTYQWKRDTVAIDGAEAAIYTLVEADSGTNVTVTVTARNMVGAAAATSTNKAVA